ncbi:MAG TPA: cytochrome D ubiquinol oxidase subunit II, partial [Gammaproteobacteria bacterium]|nr:cytochrome D ubiquinol oxidase subunit II [Gammaproteobacteria bacterium]MCH76959.1 cytochrome D ubiquinol oxidase subunit II [Gammaproteobacteria bacterium]
TQDPDAPVRVQEILDSPTYRIADQDPDFLGREDTRGLRLQVDYLKPELLLREHGIEHTIVVFGGTRINEAVAAADTAAARREAAAA